MRIRLGIVSIILVLAFVQAGAAQVVRVLPETLDARSGRDGKWLILTVQLEQSGGRSIRSISLSVPRQLRLRYFDSPPIGCGLDGGGMSADGVVVWSHADSGEASEQPTATDTCRVGRFSAEVEGELREALIFPAIIVRANGDSVFFKGESAPRVITHRTGASPVIRTLLALLLAASLLTTAWMLRVGRIRR